MSGPTTRGRAPRPQSLIPQAGISALTDAEAAGFGLILRPVRTSFAKINARLGDILGTSGSGKSTPSADQNGKDTKSTEDKTSQVVEDAQKGIKQSIDAGEFSATLQSGATAKSYGRYILLPLPINIIDALSINYTTTSLGSAAAGFSLGTDVAQAIQNGGSLSDPALSAANYIIRSAIGSAGTAFLGNVPNPFAANVFENVEPRSFNFQFNIQPKNAQESENIRSIINIIRYYALPNPTDNGLLLEVPWEWELGFLNTDYLYSFSRCALTRMEANYTQTGGAVFFETGAPKDIVLNLEFREIFPLNQKVITGFTGDGSQSMSPTSPSAVSESGGDGAGEATGVDPETGLTPESSQNAQAELKKELARLESENVSNTQKIAELQGYLLRTDLTAKQREDATLERERLLANSVKIQEAIDALVTQING